MTKACPAAPTCTTLRMILLKSPINWLLGSSSSFSSWSRDLCCRPIPRKRAWGKDTCVSVTEHTQTHIPSPLHSVFSPDPWKKTHYTPTVQQRGRSLPSGWGRTSWQWWEPCPWWGDNPPCYGSTSPASSGRKGWTLTPARHGWWLAGTRKGQQGQECSSELPRISVFGIYSGI